MTIRTLCRRTTGFLTFCGNTGLVSQRVGGVIRIHGYFRRHRCPGAVMGRCTSITRHDRR